MPQTHLTPPDPEELRGEIGHDVYVSPELARKDLGEAEKIWANEVSHRSGGKLKGEIRDYEGTGPANTHSDMRLTWTLAAIGPKGKIVASARWVPYGDVDDVAYGLHDELAGEVVKGTLSLREAKRNAQLAAELHASDELEGWLDSTDFPGEEFWAKVEKAKPGRKG